MDKDKLISIIENVELKKNRPSYKFDFWMSVMTPLLLELGYPIMDLNLSEFNGELFSNTIDVEGSLSDKPLKVLFSLSDLREITQSSGYVPADFIVLFNVENNIVQLYTYSLDDYHKLHEFNIKKVDNNRYQSFIKFIKFETLTEMYKKHGHKLVTSSLLDKMLKTEDLGNNPFIQKAVKDIFENSPDELYKLVAIYLNKHYTYNSATNLMKGLKESKGTLLEAIMNSDSGGFVTMFDDTIEQDTSMNNNDTILSYTETEDNNVKITANDIKNVIEDSFDEPSNDIMEEYPQKQASSISIEDLTEDLDYSNNVSNNDDVSQSNQELGTIEELEDLEDDDFAVDIYGGNDNPSLDNLMALDGEEQKERKIPKQSSSLADFLGQP